MAVLVVVAGTFGADRIEWLRTSYLANAVGSLGSAENLSRTRDAIDRLLLPLLAGLLVVALAYRSGRRVHTGPGGTGNDHPWGSGGITSDVPATVDRLGTQPFARELAAAVGAPSTRDGLVFGLEGPWGSGKSTVLGFVEQEISSWPVERRPIVVRFNPWWFSGQDDLREQFFSEIGAQLDTRSWVARARDRFATFLASLGRRGDDVPVDSVKIAAAIARLGAAVLTRQGGAEERYRQTRALLNASPRRLVVIVEDIDRLPASEIRQMFALVKAVADFPMTTYLLAYDQLQVASALQSDAPEGGHAYLQKIVQVPMNMPAVPESRLQKWLTTELDGIVLPLQDGLWDSSLWGLHVLPAINWFVRVPRDVRRYANAVAASYPRLRNEVHVTDFLALTALEVFVPSLFQVLRRNVHVLVGGHARDSAKADALGQIREQSAGAGAPTALLISMFPELAQDLSLQPFWSASVGQLRARRRISDPDSTPLYFGGGRAAVGAVSREETIRLIGEATADEIVALLRERAEGPKDNQGDELLATLRDMHAVVVGSPVGDPAERAKVLVGSMMAVGDEFYRIEGHRPLEPDSHVFAVGVALESLRRVGDGSARATIAAEAIRAGKSATLAIKLFEEMKDEGLAAGAAIATIQSAVVELLRGKSVDGSLVDAPMLSAVLVHWAKYEDDAVVSAWVKQHAGSDLGFAELAAAHLHFSWSSETGRAAEASPEVFDRFYDRGNAAAVERATAILGDRTPGLSDEQRRGLEAIVKGRYPLD